MIKKKIKKAASGLQSVNTGVRPRDVDDRTNQAVSSTLQTAGDAFIPGLGTGIDIVNKGSNAAFKNSDGLYNNRFSQSAAALNPVEQATRIGKTIGKAFSGDFSGAGKAITGDQSELKAQIAKQKADERMLQVNRGYSADEITSNQGMQRFKKGGVVKTKTIEIEGKKTPEIHTDKNFNIKNLGTIPHSKGGNKVVAEEGDVVFNTQNSLTKYNKIASAINSGDKATLNSEKNKLPEDSGTKNQKGNRKVERDYMMEEEDREAKGLPKPKYMTKPVSRPVANPIVKPKLSSDAKDHNGYTNSDDYYKSYKGKEVITNGVRGKLANDGSGEVYYPNGRKKLPNGQMTRANALPRSPLANLTPYAKAFKGLPNTSIPDPNRSYVRPNDFTLGAGGKGANNVTINPIVNKAITGAKNKPKVSSVGKSVKVPQKVSNMPSLSSIAPTADKFSSIGDGSDLATPKASNLLDLSGAKSPVQSTASTQTTSGILDGGTTSANKNGLSNLTQFAGVANNIFQGIKKEPAIDEKYYDPEKLKYTDRSQNLRNQSNQSMNASIANARSLSGGNIGNLRANAASARLSNLSTQSGIDEREQSRADAIANQNTEISNQAKQVNLGRRDTYQQLNMQNRAAKQAYLDQAASDIGQYGMSQREEAYMRSRDDKASAAQLAGYNSINGRYQHKSNLDGSTYFEPDADSSITKYGTSGGDRRVGTRKKAFGIFKKGTKSIKVKSVV